MSTPDYLPDAETAVAVRAAQEGVPVRAIARILSFPSDPVYASLTEAKEQGLISFLPRSDWPAAESKEERAPVGPTHLSESDLILCCQQKFRLTNLEAAFLACLLRSERVDKTKLHGVVERQRAKRQSRPNSTEATDIKMVDVMICKLRKKMLSHNPLFVIKTIWGGGYHMDKEVRLQVFSTLNEGTSGL